MSETVILGIVALALGIAAGYVSRQVLAAKAAKQIEEKAKSEYESAKLQARELIVEAKDKVAAMLEEARVQERELKNQVEKTEERLLKREELIERQVKELSHKESKITEETARLEETRGLLAEKQKGLTGELERIAGLSVEDAKKSLFKRIEEDYAKDIVYSIQKIEQDRKEEIEKKSLEIITTAMQRYARSNVADVTTSVLNLPNEEIKGKIIGREGRNIRALERLTGVEFIIDEAPESIIISSFDPLRREIAKLALEKLIKDGRIQPVKIEEKVTEATNEIEKRMMEIGEQAAYDVGVVDFPKEIIRLLGRLHFRTSYGQNVLQHSVEMAHMAGMIAAELGANVEIAKRGALLHDIGKAISHEVEGTHVELGRKILQKYGIADEVVKAMEAHHEEYPFSTTESFIVAAVDALSAARPGARRDTVEQYIKRLGDLEKIANAFPGVKAAYALSAGREVRVFVVPEKIDDFGALSLAKEIAGKIQNELKYPGEIKVNVIREIRAVEYAR